MRVMLQVDATGEAKWRLRCVQARGPCNTGSEKKWGAHTDGNATWFMHCEFKARATGARLEGIYLECTAAES
eukprot:1161133-Pelagomonas_calceolata.AAC.11